MRLYSVRVDEYPIGSYIWAHMDSVSPTMRPDALDLRVIDDELYGAFLDPAWCPIGWAKYAEQHFGDANKGFFWPKTDGVWKSRSTAKRRVDMIERWGGKATVLEAEAEFIPVAEANAKRAARRLSLRDQLKKRSCDDLAGLAAYTQGVAL